MMINYNIPRRVTRILPGLTLALGFITYSGAGVAAAPEKIVDADCYATKVLYPQSQNTDPLAVDIEVVIENAWAGGQRSLKDVHYDFGDSTSETTRAQRIEHVYPEIGQYIVQVNASELDGQGNTMLGGTTCPNLIVDVPIYGGTR